MARSYNSRKGHYGCHCRREFTIDRFSRMNKSKQNLKQKAIKFDGIPYSYKRKKSFKKDNGLNHGIFHEFWFVELPKIENERMKETKKSYRDWSWLKGKPNPKHWVVTKAWEFADHGSLLWNLQWRPY